MAERWSTRHAALVGFVLLAAGFGSLYAIFMPPLQIADEIAHLYRAVGVSQGHCVAPDTVSFPRSLEALHRAFPPAVEKHHLIRWAEVELWRQVPLEPGDTVPVNSIAADVYSCLPYLPAGVAIRAASELLSSPVGVLRAGRFGTLVVFIAIVAFAIHLAPDVHAGVLAVGLLPIALHQAASLSADGITIAIAILATSLVFNLANRRSPLRPIHVVGLMGTMCALALTKSNAILAALVLLIPDRVFASRRQRVAIVSAAAVMVLGTSALWNWANQDNVARFALHLSSNGVDTSANLRAVVIQPAEFLSAVARTMAAYYPNYAQQALGVLGWATLPLPAWALVVCAICLVLAARTATGSASVPGAARLVCGVVAGLGVLAAFAAMWTILGRSTRGAPWPSGALIEGVAGRYFVPLLLPLVIGVSGHCRLVSRYPKTCVVTIAAAMAVVNVAAVISHDHDPPLRRYSHDHDPGGVTVFSRA